MAVPKQNFPKNTLELTIRNFSCHFILFYVILFYFSTPISAIRILQDTNQTSSPPAASKSGGSDKLPWYIIFIIVFIVAHLIGCPPFLYFMWRKYSNRKRPGGFLQMKLESHYVKFVSLREVLSATDTFSPSFLLGEGGYGAVYKGTAKNGEKWAVKRAHRTTKEMMTAFQNEVDLLSRMMHVNIVQLLGFCNEDNELILIYEYVSGGTLLQRLRVRPDSGAVSLSFKQRVDIAIGACQGLQYLHKFAQEPVIHRDVKTENILLTEDLKPKVADFGLLKLLPKGPNAASHVTTRVAGTFGYMDPEYQEANRTTTKSDVFSFGVVLLELLTGQPPIRGVDDQRVPLTRWALSLIERGDIETLADPSLNGNFSNESFLQLVNVAFQCLRPYGENRPTMEEVTRMLQYIKSENEDLIDSPNASDVVRDGPNWSFPVTTDTESSFNTEMRGRQFNDSSSFGHRSPPVTEMSGVSAR